MRLSIITPPPVEPVTLGEIYLHLRLDASGSPPSHPDDDMLNALIQAAREHVEQVTRRCLIQQTVRYTLPYFPTDRVFFLPRRFYDETLTDYVKPYYLELPKSCPLISLSSIKYYDTSNVLQTLDPTLYQVGVDSLPIRIDLAWGQTWPQTYERPDAVQIAYISGYMPTYTGSPPVVSDYRANVPQSIKTAIKLHVQKNYDPMTPDKSKQIDDTISALLASYRVHTFEYGYPSP